MQQAKRKHDDCSCPCLTPGAKRGPKTSSTKKRALRYQFKARVDRQILPALDRMTEAELLKALARQGSEGRFPVLHRLATKQESEYDKAVKQLTCNVRDALQGAGRHHRSKWAKALTKGLSSEFKKEYLNMTPSQAAESCRRMSASDVDYFRESYPAAVHRQRISDLEKEGWLHVAESCLEQKSGDTDKPVFYIRGDRMAWFWEKLAPRAWQVYKWCFEQEPLFNYRPPKSRKETWFERNMRVWMTREKKGREIPEVTLPKGGPERHSLDGDDYEPPVELTNCVGYDTILCRTPATVWNLISRNRGKKSG